MIVFAIVQAKMGSGSYQKKLILNDRGKTVIERYIS